LKKIISLIGIVLICAVGAQAQLYQSDPVTVNLTWNYLPGVSLWISNTNISWTDIPLNIDPLLDQEYLPNDEGPSEAVISFKVTFPNKVQLVCETTEMFEYNGIKNKSCSYFMHHEATGGFFMAEQPLPNPEDAQQIMWTSVDSNGKKNGTILWKVLNGVSGGADFPFSGFCIYTAIEAVI